LGKIKYLFLALCTMLLMINIPQYVQAAEGSISVTLAEGEAQIYHVANMEMNDLGYVFTYTDTWKECGVVLDDVQNAGIAEELAVYAKESEIEGSTCFTGLEEGLYLIVQMEAVEGYQTMKPFLVTMPTVIDGECIYDIEASPKVEPGNPDGPGNPEGPGNPDEPGNPDGPDSSGDEGDVSENKGDKLPQTGQLNWPIPVLVITGLLLFASGWYICFAKKDD